MMLKLTSRMTNTTMFYKLYKVLKSRQFLINLGTLGVLFEVEHPHVEVSIVALGEDYDKDIFQMVPFKDTPKRVKNKPNAKVKESKEESIFQRSK